MINKIICLDWLQHLLRQPKNPIVASFPGDPDGYNFTIDPEGNWSFSRIGRFIAINRYNYYTSKIHPDDGGFVYKYTARGVYIVADKMSRTFRHSKNGVIYETNYAIHAED